MYVSIINSLYECISAAFSWANSLFLSFTSPLALFTYLFLFVFLCYTFYRFLIYPAGGRSPIPVADIAYHHNARIEANYRAHSGRAVTFNPNNEGYFL